MSAELRIGVKNPGRFPAKFTRPKVVPDLIISALEHDDDIIVGIT